MRNTIRDTVLAMLLAVPLFAICFPADYHTYSTEKLLVLLLLSPISEELIFRGILQEYLLRRSSKPWHKYLSNIIVSIIFTVAHFLVSFNPQRLLVFFPSLVLGAHYGKHRLVLAVILIHAIYNASIL